MFACLSQNSLQMTTNPPSFLVWGATGICVWPKILVDITLLGLVIESLGILCNFFWHDTQHYLSFEPDNFTI